MQRDIYLAFPHDVLGQTNMKKSAVLILGRVDTNTEEYKEFASRFECIHYDVTSADQLLEDFNTRFHHIEAIFANWGGFEQAGGFRGKLVEQAPPNLKLVAMCQIGHDGFDLDAMRDRGIMLTNVPTPLAHESVADLVLYNALASFRNFKLFERGFIGSQAHTSMVRNLVIFGQWDAQCGQQVLQQGKVPMNFAEAACGRLNHSPRGHNAVIVGFGNIGKNIGQRLSAIGMNIHYVKRTPMGEAEAKELGYEATFHKTVLDAKDIADLIIVACPGNASTKHMINKNVIDSMRNPFRIINIGRGYVVDESALVDGLKLGKVLFAGLDVFEQEPAVHPELLNRADVVLTPHIGSGTSELFYHAQGVCYQNIKSVLYLSGEVTGLLN